MSSNALHNAMTDPARAADGRIIMPVDVIYHGRSGADWSPFEGDDGDLALRLMTQGAPIRVVPRPATGLFRRLRRSVRSRLFKLAFGALYPGRVQIPDDLVWYRWNGSDLLPIQDGNDGVAGIVKPAALNPDPQEGFAQLRDHDRVQHDRHVGVPSCEVGLRVSWFRRLHGLLRFAGSRQ